MDEELLALEREINPQHELQTAQEDTSPELEALLSWLHSNGWSSTLRIRTAHITHALQRVCSRVSRDRSEYENVVCVVTPETGRGLYVITEHTAIQCNTLSCKRCAQNYQSSDCHVEDSAKMPFAQADA